MVADGVTASACSNKREAILLLLLLQVTLDCLAYNIGTACRASVCHSPTPHFFI
jgi:hypothetical protein